MPTVTLPRHATLERCRMNSHAGAWEPGVSWGYFLRAAINHQKRPFAERSRSELSASTPLSERFNLKLSQLKTGH